MRLFMNMHLCALLCVVMVISSCGKHEADGGVMGAATGALIGSSVSKNKDSAKGALIGGLIGNTIGRSIGRAADDEELDQALAARERRHARHREQTQHELERVRDENRRLKEKWCSRCGRQVSIARAKSCPSCGGGLFHERYCGRCLNTFSIQSGYRYCPYCPVSRPLNLR